MLWQQWCWSSYLIHNHIPHIQLGSLKSYADNDQLYLSQREIWTWEDFKITRGTSNKFHACHFLIHHIGVPSIVGYLTVTGVKTGVKEREKEKENIQNRHWQIVWCDNILRRKQCNDSYRQMFAGLQSPVMLTNREADKTKQREREENN